MMALSTVHQGRTRRQEEVDICFHAMWLWSDSGDYDEDMPFVLPTLHSAVLIIIGAHTEPRLNAATS